MEIKKIVKDILEKNYLKDEEGFYYQDIYCDYQDKLEDSDIKDILDNESSNDRLFEVIDESYSEYSMEIENEAVCIVKEKIESLDEDVIITDDEIIEIVNGMFYVNLPLQHYNSQKVKVDLIIDTGDSDSEFTLNYTYGEKFTAEKECSLLWLAETQGYSKEDLENAINENEYKESRFLKSVSEEYLNCTTSMNCISFFINTDIETLINFSDNKKDIEKIIIWKNTNCGLIDYWCGGGSILEIELEKDIEVPVQYVYSLSIDGDIGYGANEIYGLHDSHWNGKCNLIKKKKEEKIA